VTAVFDSQLGETAEVRLEQGVVRYHSVGSGPPVVFVHGLMTNAAVWHKVVPLLADRVRCVTPDLPLGSHSVPLEPDADLSLPGLARLVQDFVEALDLRDVTLVGCTAGGVICQLIAVDQPARIGRMVLLPSDAYDNVPPKVLRYLRWAPKVPGMLWLLGNSLRIPANRTTPFSYGWVSKKGFEKHVLESFIRPQLSTPGVRHDLAKVLRDLRPIHTRSAAARFGETDLPVLLVWSQEDRLFPYEHAERLASELPKARLETVPDSYTYVVQDQPGRVARLIAGFVATDGRTASSDPSAAA
jgi:pimeloyl-ACP methyl ester carboxylesterase